MGISASVWQGSRASPAKWTLRNAPHLHASTVEAVQMKSMDTVVTVE